MTNNNLTKVLFMAAVIALQSACSPKISNPAYQVKHKPQYHFSPKEKWMNDPNGMVYLNGSYHLFFQYYPEGTIWGPMHWGHAESKDLVHWKEQPIALYPDSLGWIFSGSAVVDKNNTSGLGKDGKAPLVAIFTHHNKALEVPGTTDFQYQSIAYSLDEGKSWIKYAGNPVLKNPGITDFRDPKVMWYEEGNKWVMALATKDRVTFYSSPNLTDWTRESDIGSDFGAHGGVWECPELLSLEHNGKKHWVLLVSLNPGGPNGGSATQYFVGDFDGKEFKPYSKETKWLDWGTDNYAGVTFFNTGNRRIFMGWMNNWQYANLVPTTTWRGANTLPRDLKLTDVNGSLFVSSHPVPELSKIVKQVYSRQNIELSKELDLSSNIKNFKGRFKLDLALEEAKDFSISVSNDKGEVLLIGYEKSSNQYFIDRTNAGEKNFEIGFAKKHIAPRISNSNGIELTLFIDAASAEVFADNGLNVFTEVFFPTQVPGNLIIRAEEKNTLKKISLSEVKSIWTNQR